MDKDRIAGSAKDFAGKVEGALGDIAISRGAFEHRLAWLQSLHDR